jgi:hypothetical protein
MTYTNPTTTSVERLAMAIRAEVAQALANDAQIWARQVAQSLGQESPQDQVTEAPLAVRGAEEAEQVAALAMAELSRFGHPSGLTTLQEWLGASAEEFDEVFLAALRQELNLVALPEIGGATEGASND